MRHPRQCDQLSVVHMCCPGAGVPARVKWELPSEDHGSPVSEYLLEFSQLEGQGAPQLWAPEGHQGSGEGGLGQSQGLLTQGQGQGMQQGVGQDVGQSMGQGQGLGMWQQLRITGTSAKLPELQPGAVYLVRVAACNGAGWGPACAPARLVSTTLCSLRHLALSLSLFLSLSL